MSHRRDALAVIARDLRQMVQVLDLIRHEEKGTELDSLIADSRRRLRFVRREIDRALGVRSGQQNGRATRLNDG